MNRWIKKLHMYLGLLNFSSFLLFGIAGLTVTFEASPDLRARPAPMVTFADYRAPSGAGDRQVAEEVYRLVKVPLTSPVPEYAIQRDRDGNLTFTLYNASGPNQVTVLERENRVRVESLRNSVWRYLDNLHTVTSGHGVDDWRMRLWGYYTELAIWSLIAMACSGMYLWASSRPGYRPAQAIVLAGAGIVAILYYVTR